MVKLNYRLGSCWQTLERKILAGISRKEAVADSGAKAGISETLDPHSDVQALKPEVAAHIWWFSFHLAQAATAGLNLCSLEWAQVEWNRGGKPELRNGELACVLVKLSQGLIHNHWQKQASGWEWIDFRIALGFPSAWWGQPTLPGSVGSQQSLRQALRQRRQGAVGVNALLLPISHPNPEYRPQAMSWPKPPSLSHAKDLRTSKELLLGQHRVTQLPAVEPWFQKLSAKDCLDYRHIKPSDDVLPPSPAHIASLLVIYMVLTDWATGVSFMC